MAAVYESKVDELEEGEALLPYDQCATTEQESNHSFLSKSHLLERVLLGQACEGSPAGEQGMSHYHSLTSPKCPQNHPEEQQ